MRGPAMKEIRMGHRREVARHLNNRAENCHLSIRPVDLAMSRFRRMSKLQKFVSTRASFHNRLNPDRHINDLSTSKSMKCRALRQYLRKGTDPWTHTQAQLDEIVRSLDERQRKMLGYETPA